MHSLRTSPRVRTSVFLGFHTWSQAQGRLTMKYSLLRTPLHPRDFLQATQPDFSGSLQRFGGLTHWARHIFGSLAVAKGQSRNFTGLWYSTVPSNRRASTGRRRTPAFVLRDLMTTRRPTETGADITRALLV